MSLPEPRPKRTRSPVWLKLKAAALPVRSEKDVSKLSMVWRDSVPTFTVMEVERPPAVAVMVPEAPGVPEAVKLPLASMVPMSPETVQVKAPAPEARARWL